MLGATGNSPKRLSLVNNAIETIALIKLKLSHLNQD